MISVCMATYNGAKYIKQQVDSILVQLGESDEIVVSDDGSTDSTVEILRGYEDPRIKIFRNEVAKQHVAAAADKNGKRGRRAIVANFESALSKAQGDYIFLCDQDDVWLEDKVQICVSALQHSDFVLHDAYVWSGEKILHNSFFKLRNVGRGYWRNLYKNGYIGCCMAFTKRVKDRVLPMPEGVAMHDIYIGLIAERNFKIELIHKPLLRYRRHGDNASNTAERSTISRFEQLRYRLHMFSVTIF